MPGVTGLFTDVGNGLKYAAQQCTAFVADVFGWVPAGWGNAGDWLAHAKAQGYTISSTPVVGSVAVWAPNRGGAFSAGHVAAVVGVNGGLPVVNEADFAGSGGALTSGGVGHADIRAVTPDSASGIIGYILPKGATVNSSDPNSPSYFGAAFGEAGSLTGLPGGQQIGTAVGTAVGVVAGGVDPLTAVGKAIAGIPAAIIAQVGAAIGGALSTIGHAIANVLGVATTDVGRVVQNHLVPVTVAAAVTAALFV